MITKKNENVPIYHSYLKGNSLVPTYQDPFLAKYSHEVFSPDYSEDAIGQQVKNYYRDFQNFIKRQLNGLNITTVKWKKQQESFEFWVCKKCYFIYGFYNTFNYATLLSYNSVENPYGVIIGPASAPGVTTRMPIRVPLGTVGKEINYLAHQMALYEKRPWGTHDKDEKFLYTPPIEEKNLFQYYPIPYAVASIKPSS